MSKGHELTLADLGALAVPSARGRAAKPLEIEYVRDITPADMEVLLSPAPKGSQAPQLLKLRNTHHQLARLLATGVKQAEISLVTGYSQSRISILKNDPAFQELVEYYHSQAEAKYVEAHEKLATVGISAVEQLQERLEEEKLTNRELLELAEFCLDRSLTPGAKSVPGGSNGGVNIAINFVKPEERPDTGKVIDVE